MAYTQALESLLGLQRPPGYDVQFFRGTGWGPARRHIVACEKALAWGADWILILGADQEYEPDLLCRLVARVEQGCEVISALVPTRGMLGRWDMQPFQPMAWRLKSNGLGPIRWDNGGREAVETVKREDGELQRIDFIGSGCLMFHRDHILMLKRPWFKEKIDPETQNRTASMDTTFVFRLHDEAGAQVWCDTTIRIRHLHLFPVDDTFSERFKDYAEPGVGDPDICQFPQTVAAD